MGCVRENMAGEMEVMIKEMLPRWRTSGSAEYMPFILMQLLFLHSWETSCTICKEH